MKNICYILAMRTKNAKDKTKRKTRVEKKKR